MTGGLANAYIKLDLNKIRVSTRHDLVNSIIRLRKRLSYYFLRKDSNWLKSEECFLSLADIEAMLSLSAQCSTFSQHEKLCARTLRVLAKQRTMSKLRNEKVYIIYLNEEANSYTLPRIDKKPVS